ncbi:AarF/ABC1/UbiB kinase family protein [Candidatus Giovannonibacteria bacterium]|nr:AarF/ABC1/UbiB kinase family protein [Candidatus Giovannonibacteria bacterium]
MRRIFRALERYFIIFEVGIDHGLKLLKHKFLGGEMNYISPAELRKILEELGGSFLKFGQLAAVRPDYFPEEYCRELLGLLDEVPPIDDSLLEGIFLDEFGKKPEEIFREFNRIPIAAASFGQVHEAYLPEGERVAVKIQRPFVAEDFYADARFFSFLGWAIKKSGIVKSVDPVKIVREFIHWTERELDYVKEAEHMVRLGEQVLNNKLPVRIPKVYPEYTTRRILVMEFLDGRTLKSYYKTKAELPNGHKFFRDAIFFELYSFLFDGFFHADPHPANILILNSGELAFVDMGIAADINVSDRKKLGKFLKAVVEENLDLTVATFLDMVRTPLLETLAEARKNYPQHWMRIQFIKKIFLKKIKVGLKELIHRWHEASRAGGRIHDKSPMHKFMELLLLAERSGIKMPDQSVLFARTFLSIDVIGLELVPEFNIPAALNDFFRIYAEKFREIENAPDELPYFMKTGISDEWAAILKATDDEIKSIDKELLVERVSGIMESFE